MDRVAFHLRTREVCVCRGSIVLNGLMLGNGICAVLAGDFSMELKPFTEINRGRFAHQLYDR